MSTTIKKYQSNHVLEWNDFIKQSTNATFLIHRDFMEYHKDRFVDASFMVFHNDSLVACVAGNEVDKHFYSHQGLTYGGVFIKENLTAYLYELIIKESINYLKAHYISIQWRWQPEIYNSWHQQTIESMDNHGFKTVQILNNLHACLHTELDISSKKSVGYRNGKFDDMTLVINKDFKLFWEVILVPQLLARHQAKPVHSIKEITWLGANFPNQIKQYLVYEKGELLAGVTFFLKGTIAKSQYAAATLKGMKKSALDFLYLEATQDFKDAGFEFIDYGHVNDSDGSINRGLQRFKEELGAVNQLVYSSQWEKL